MPTAICIIIEKRKIFTMVVSVMGKHIKIHEPVKLFHFLEALMLP